MSRFALTLAVLLVHATLLTTAIDLQCQWPCANESEVCKVTSTATGWSTQCQPLDQAQWILVSPESDPVFYTSNTFLLPTLGQPCHLPPPAVSASTASCARGLICTRSTFSSTLPTCTLPHPNRILNRREPDKNTGTFANHTTAFNVIHVIAAVLGIIGATLVGITVYIMYRRRRRHAARQWQQASTITSTDSQEAYMIRFNQFAQDYCRGNDDEARPIAPLPKAHIHKTSLTSPTMQQFHLHRQLIEQHQTRRPPPPYQP